MAQNLNHSNPLRAPDGVAFPLPSDLTDFRQLGLVKIGRLIDTSLMSLLGRARHVDGPLSNGGVDDEEPVEIGTT